MKIHEPLRVRIAAARRWADRLERASLSLDGSTDDSEDIDVRSDATDVRSEGDWMDIVSGLAGFRGDIVSALG